MVYIYGLVCPLAQTVRYVGKSVNPQARFRAHLSSSKRGAYAHRTARWLRKLQRAGLRPTLVILREVEPGERWQDVERELIAAAEINGWRLTNSTVGGEGLDYADPEAKAAYAAKLSATMRALWSTPERREEARERSRRVHADPDVSRRRADSLRDAYQDPELKAQARRVGAAIGARPEVKAARSAKAKAMWADPNSREAIAAGHRAAHDKMSAAAKAKYADPEKGARLRALAADPAKRAKLAEAARRRATPEYRAMMAEKTRVSWEKRRQNKG